MPQPRKFRGGGGVRPPPLFKENPEGRGSSYNFPPWGVWIFSGTTQFRKKLCQKMLKVKQQLWSKIPELQTSILERSILVPIGHDGLAR